VSLDREHPAALDDGARALEPGSGLEVGREMHQAGGRVRSARRVPVGFAPDQRRLDEGSPAQAVSRGPCLTRHGRVEITRRGDEVEVRVTQGLAERRWRIPGRRGEALNVPQARGREDPPSLLEHRAALAARLLLKLDRHAWTHMGVIQAVHGADRKSTRLNSSHVAISYAVFCLKKKKQK